MDTVCADTVVACGCNAGGKFLGANLGDVRPPGQLLWMAPALEDTRDKADTTPSLSLEQASVKPTVVSPNWSFLCAREKRKG